MITIKKFIALIFSVIFLTCSTNPVKVEVVVVEVVKPGDVEKLEIFFKRSDLDSMKAGKVLEKQNIIQHLTHLRKMDSGGKKYYLLEKDDITKMINSVTEGIYLDYILINKHGDIIYTNKSDELFGTNVEKAHELTPLNKCFSNRTGIFFEDVNYMSNSSKIYSLYVSNPVYVEGEFHGVLILQVDIKKICEVLKEGTEIIDRDGIIRVTPNPEKEFSKYYGFENIDLKNLESNGVVYLNQTAGRIKFSSFNYKEIKWIIISNEL